MLNMKEGIDTSKNNLLKKKLLIIKSINNNHNNKKKIKIILALRLTQCNQWLGVDHVYIYINKKTYLC